MRTSSIISYTAILATSTSYALSFASPDSFDTSLLRGRSFLPDVVSSDSVLLVKRAEGQWDCADDEEFVPYDDDDEEGDDEEQDDTPVFQPNKGEVKAVAPTTTLAANQEQSKTTSQEQQPQKQEATKPAAPAPEATKPAAQAVKAVSTTSSNVSTPENIAEGTYTAEEGCARFYTVQAGDICLGLVEKNADLGLTLDQLYCLNPAIDDLCYNLWIGTSYCVGYSGEEPLNTGVSSKRA